MSDLIHPATSPETFDILGTWRLVAMEEWLEEQCTQPYLYGRQPNGLIHYLPGNRVAAVIAMGGRPKMSTGYREAPDSILAEAARTFSAYAGKYTRDGAIVTHHIEINSYENDVGENYVRKISLQRDNLVLTSPSYGNEDSGYFIRAIWERV